MTKIAFVRPGGHYGRDFPDSPRIGIPLGLLYLAGVFKDDPAVECKIFDALAYPNLKRFKPNKGTAYFGKDINELVTEVKEYNPDLIAVSTMADSFARNAIDLMNAIHECVPNATKILGGADPTGQPELYLNAIDGLDAVVYEEGELTLRELVDRLKKGEKWLDIKGIIYKKGENIVRNPKREWIEDLDNYLPDYSLIDFEQYFKLNRLSFPARTSYAYPGSDRNVLMITSRGCPYKCTFCSIAIHSGRKYRSHSPGFVVNHIRILHEQFGINHFHFEDDNLSLNLSRFKAILKGIIQSKLRITWDTPNGIRGDLLDEESLLLAKKSGCIFLCFGIEGHNDRIVNEISNKEMDLGKVTDTISACARIGIDTQAFFILGLPGETYKDLVDTKDYSLSLLRKYGTAPVVIVFRPIKGTDLHTLSVEKEYIFDATESNAHLEFGIPRAMIAEKMIKTNEISLYDVAKVYNSYSTVFVRRAFLNWIKIISSNPRIILSRLAGLLIKIISNPFRARHVVIRYLFNTMIYPNAIRRQIGHSGANQV
jgi:anaerobic magnesium-protoporphyrin IX monomethyl ester cyclase